MLKQSSESPSSLRKQVTSPGGTTEAGIQLLQECNFEDIIANCLNKAEKRSRELGMHYI